MSGEPDLHMGNRPRSGPLVGVRVLDLSRLLPGPACTWLLRGQGAEVWRVEPPEGDPMRSLPPLRRDGVGQWFATLHGGKRSVVLDLKNPLDVERCLELALHVDVVVEGFRPGVMARLGLDPRELLAKRPDLIVASISGFGQTGPWAQRAGHDLLYLAVAGALSTSSGERPRVPQVQVADWFGGAQNAAFQIVSALFERNRTGHGRWLDISMTEGSLPLGMGRHGGVAEGVGLIEGTLPTYDTYRCADGRFLAVGALEPKFRAALEAALEVDVSNAAAVAAVLATRDRDEWVERLALACVAPILEPAELASHPQHRHRGSFDSEGQLRGGTDDPPQGGLVSALGAETDDVFASVRSESPRQSRGLVTPNS